MFKVLNLTYIYLWVYTWSLFSLVVGILVVTLWQLVSFYVLLSVLLCCSSYSSPYSYLSAFSPCLFLQPATVFAAVSLCVCFCFQLFYLSQPILSLLFQHFSAQSAFSVCVSIMVYPVYAGLLCICFLLMLLHCFVLESYTVSMFTILVITQRSVWFWVLYLLEIILKYFPCSLNPHVTNTPDLNQTISTTITPQFWAWLKTLQGWWCVWLW